MGDSGNLKPMPSDANFNSISNSAGVHQADKSPASDLDRQRHVANPTAQYSDDYPHSALRLALFPIAIKFEEVVYKVKKGGGRGSRWCFNGSVDKKGDGDSSAGKRTILKGISGQVFPGEILAMLGPSGSGKTTLLTALGGRLSRKELSGKITYNGLPFSGTLKRRTGFVAQVDVLYPHLTVTETLFFTALLQLPRTLSRAEKAEHAERVIAELGLGSCRHSMVGGTLFRGISGGEKKRVSIGQEMLVNPSLLLLDEPTSGLDSTTALRIMATVKRLASGGRTVVTTVHQPSSRLYRMFNKVVVLSEGSPIYYGDASHALEYFSSVGYPSPVATVNPADFLLDLAHGIAPQCDSMLLQNEEDEEEQRKSAAVRELLISLYEKNIAAALKAELDKGGLGHGHGHSIFGTSGGKGEKEKWSSSWWVQFKVLLKRGLRERRHEAFNKLRIFQVTSVATLAGLLWWHSPLSHIQDRIALLFFFSVFWGFFPLYNAVFTFPQERAMLVKERASRMYRLSSYFMARMAGDLPMELALPTAFVIIIYWMGGLKPDTVSFLLSLLVVLLSVLVSQSLGLALGAILMDVKQAATLASVTTLVFLVAGGYYVQQIPPFIVWLKYLSFSYYCYKMLLGVQFTDEDYYQCSSTRLCKVIDYPAVKSVGLKNVWVDVFIMLIMLVGYRIIAYLALHRLQMR